VAFIVREIPGKVCAKSALPIIAIVVMSVLFVAAGWPASNWLANLALPPAIAGLAALVFQLMKNIARKTRSVRVFGLDLLHLGLALTLVGVFISGGAAQAVQVAEVQLGEPEEILGIQMVFDNAISEISSGDVELSDGIYPEYISLRMDASVTQAGNDYHTFLEARLYPALGIIIAPTIVRTPSGDIYIHVDQSDALISSLMTATSGDFTAPESLDLTVKTIPWVNLVWAGSALLSIGVSVILAKELGTPRQEPAEKNLEGNKKSQLPI